MKEISPLQYKLQELAKSSSLESLDSFEDPSVWKQLKQKDRELLGQLLITKGCTLLDQGDSRALNYFEKAALAASHSSKIH